MKICHKTGNPRIVKSTNFSWSALRLQKWYFVTKIVLTYFEKKISSDREKLLKFKAEVRSNIYSLFLIRSFNNLNNVSFSNNLSLKKREAKTKSQFRVVRLPQTKQHLFSNRPLKSNSIET